MMKRPAEAEESPWIELSEGLVAGIHHALNNRMAALGGAVQVLQGDIEVEHPLITVLSSEIRRLEATASLLRYLSAGDGSFEPVQVSEVLGQAVKLFEIHHALRDLRLDIRSADELLPVWTAPAGLLRTVMVMVAAAGGGIARESGWGSATEGKAIELRVSGDPISVRIVANVPKPLEDVGLPRVYRGDVERMAWQIGATFRATDTGGMSQWELELPTLPEARRREREGATR